MRRDRVACERKVIFELDGTSRKVSRESSSHDGVAVSRFDGIRLDRVDEALVGLALPRTDFFDSTVSPTFVLDHGIRRKALDGAVEVSRVACLNEACDLRRELDHFLMTDSMDSQRQISSGEPFCGADARTAPRQHPALLRAPSPRASGSQA
jgi:hypothetical protein